jgi:hypothetical protein
VLGIHAFLAQLSLRSSTACHSAELNETFCNEINLVLLPVIFHFIKFLFVLFSTRLDSSYVSDSHNSFWEILEVSEVNFHDSGPTPWIRVVLEKLTVA